MELSLVANEIKKQTEKNSDTDNSVENTRSKGMGVAKGKGGRIYGDERRFDSGW